MGEVSGPIGGLKLQDFAAPSPVSWPFRLCLCLSVDWRDRIARLAVCSGGFAHSRGLREWFAPESLVARGSWMNHCQIGKEASSECDRCSLC